jgi:HTH-type transcriptional regulator / antitoxin MqsA
MSGIWHDKPCPTCGLGILRDGQKTEVTEYRGREFVSSQTGAYCDSCEDGIVYHDPATAEAWVNFRKSVHEDERREIMTARQRLGLTQHEAARIAGGGHNAFSRYERGEAHPVLGVVNLFRLLGRYPQLLFDLGLRPRQALWTNWGICRSLQVPAIIAAGASSVSTVDMFVCLDRSSTYALANWAITVSPEGQTSSEEVDVEAKFAAFESCGYLPFMQVGHYGAD